MIEGRPQRNLCQRLGSWYLFHTFPMSGVWCLLWGNSISNYTFGENWPTLPMRTENNSYHMSNIWNPPLKRSIVGTAYGKQFKIPSFESEVEKKKGNILYLLVNVGFSCEFYACRFLWFYIVWNTFRHLAQSLSSSDLATKAELAVLNLFHTIYILGWNPRTLHSSYI